MDGRATRVGVGDGGNCAYVDGRPDMIAPGGRHRRECTNRKGHKGQTGRQKYCAYQSPLLSCRYLALLGLQPGSSCADACMPTFVAGYWIASKVVRR